MKKKIPFLVICIMQLCLTANQNVIAQQPQAKPANHSLVQIHYGQPARDYTYKVFQAPDKMFGYDIFKNGKGVFHQPAVMVYPNNITANQRSTRQNLSAAANDQGDTPTGISKIEFAENAALLSIEKIRKGSGPALTNEEMKQVFASKIPVTKKN